MGILLLYTFIMRSTHRNLEESDKVLRAAVVVPGLLPLRHMVMIINENAGMIRVFLLYSAHGTRFSRWVRT